MPTPKKQFALTEMSVGETMSIVAASPRPLRFKIVGIGGAGVTALAALQSEPLESGERIAIDTDAKSLARATRVQKIRIGESLTHGISTGGDTAIGRQAIEIELEKLQETLAGAELIVLVAGLGGGTGSGAAPAVAQIAQQLGALTLTVALLPFEFESPLRRATASQAANQLRAICDGTLFVAQDTFMTSDGDNASADDSFRRAESLADQAIASLVAMLTCRGMGKISVNDLRKAWGSSRSQMAFGCGQAGDEGIDQVGAALRQALETPSCSAEILAEANQIFVHLHGTDLRLTETMAAMRELQVTYPDSRISLCASLDAKQNERCRVAIFAAQATEESATAVAEPPPRLPMAAPLLASPTPAKRRARPQQQTLNLDPTSLGRFEKSDPTIYEGEDLDTPTFLRKKVRLS